MQMKTADSNTGENHEPQDHQGREIPDMAGGDTTVPLPGLSIAIVRPQVLHSIAPRRDKLTPQQSNLNMKKQGYGRVS